MRTAILTAFSLAAALPASAQEVSVPSVTTASPGGYANPLKLDTDRYKRKTPSKTSQSAPAGRCNGKPMTAGQRARLEAGYRTHAAGGNDQRGWRWLRDQCGATSAIQIQRTARRGGRN